MARSPILLTTILTDAEDAAYLARRDAMADDGVVTAGEQQVITLLDSIRDRLAFFEMRRIVGRSIEDGCEVTPEAEALLSEWGRRQIREFHRDHDDDDPVAA